MAPSRLSPDLRHRVLTEEEVLRAVLARHAPEAAEKFIQEVFWRTDWKGWLELRPALWQDYRSRLLHQLDRVQSEEGLRHRWRAGCTRETGLDCFDAWAQELVQNGYLHNHARMWFASIWIFTLGPPWDLGAEQIVTAYAPTGPVAEFLQELDGVVQMLRPYDARAWPHATAGFFKFRWKILTLLAALDLPAGG